MLKVIMRQLAVYAGVLSISAISHSAPICFADVQSYQAVVSQLPPIMQAGGVYGFHRSMMMEGAFKINQNGGRFAIEVHGRFLSTTLNQSEFIQSICVDGPFINVVLEDGRWDVIEIRKNGFYLRGFTFKVTDQRGYDRILRKISSPRPLVSF